MTRRFGLVVLAGVLIAACAPEGPKAPEPTVAQVTITATGDANPAPGGQASPAAVYVYALKPGAPFATGPYDALTGGELGDLATTMNRIAHLVIVPGKSTKRIFELPPGTSEVGIAVAYRQIDSAQWRASAAVAPNSVTLLTATIGANAVNIQ